MAFFDVITWATARSGQRLTVLLFSSLTNETDLPLTGGISLNFLTRAFRKRTNNQEYLKICDRH